MAESEYRFGKDTGEAETGRPDNQRKIRPQSCSWKGTSAGNPFRSGEEIEKFRELYTGKCRKDRVAWSDYFLSGIFLKGYREEEFVKLMWEVARDFQTEYPPSKEFLTELYIAYGIRKVGDQFQAENQAIFTGIEYIVEIARMGPAVTAFKKNDPAMQAGFRDYRELLVLAQDETWTDAQTLYLGKIIDRYLLSNISDRPIANAGQYELSQRHPKSLKLITYFFRHTKLPDRVYRILWDHLRLDTATNGREKLLYGGLREAVLSRIPNLLEKPRISFTKVIRDFNQYDTGTSYFFNEGKTEEERQRLDCYLAREDVADALTDASFVEEQVLRYWIRKESGKYLLLKLQDYFEKHPDAPYSSQILEKIAQASKDREVTDQLVTELTEDEQSGFTWGSFDFQKRAYVRYYLNAAFHLARGIQKSICLEQYLAERMPYSPKWSRQLADPKISGLSPIQIWFEDQVLSIHFHPRHLEYRWNDSLYVPRFPGEALTDVEEDAKFWLLVPIAAAPYKEHLAIYKELMRRLSRLPVHEEDISVIADCIAGDICRLGAEDFPVCSLYAERGEQFFGCDIYENASYLLYEKIRYQKVPLPGSGCKASDQEMAVRIGTRLLRALSKAEGPIRISMAVLPKQVLVRMPYHPEKIISQEDITEETVLELLTEYFDEKLNRLELSYGGHALIFIKEGKKSAQYACFYFNHQTQDWYALVSMPELYREVSTEDVNRIPFGLGRLPDYVIHPNSGYIRDQLEDIFSQIACSVPNPRSMMWSPQIYRFETRQRYCLARRLYGGYPASQAFNQIQDRFYLPHLPVRMSYTEMDGTPSKTIEVGKQKAEVQQQLFRYMWGQLGTLTLTWQYHTSISTSCRHLVLLQDEGRHLMIYADDGREAATCLVFDKQEYMAAEGKKYRKELFLGKKVPGYLVHTNLRRIRDYLDLLISEILDPSAILDLFGEFAYEGREGYEDLKKGYL